MDNSVIVSIKDLKKSYNKSTEVLKGITLDIHKGEKIAILGANGSGKTTLVEIISDSHKPTSGKIDYNFKNKNIKFAIGIQFQEGNWPPGLSSHDLLQFYKKIYSDVTDERVKTLVKSFGMDEFVNKGLNKLSGGQKQRFNALLAILHNPELIILDEISNGLDLQLKHNILKFLKQYLKDNNNALLIVSHSPGDVEYLCDRIIIIDKGYCYFDMSVNEAIKKYKSIENLMNIYFDGKLEKHDGKN